jgi:hypothetical protein
LRSFPRSVAIGRSRCSIRTRNQRLTIIEGLIACAGHWDFAPFVILRLRAWLCPSDFQFRIPIPRCSLLLIFLPFHIRLFVSWRSLDLRWVPSLNTACAAPPPHPKPALCSFPRPFRSNPLQGSASLWRLTASLSTPPMFFSGLLSTFRHLARLASRQQRFYSWTCTGQPIWVIAGQVLQSQHLEDWA